MSRIVTESLGTAVWRAGLADPKLHWKRGRSAWEAAVSWESQRETESGLPPKIMSALSSHSDFTNPRLLLGVVEHTVVLDDPRRPSQNDLWGVLLTDAGHVSMALEAKAGEEFDKTLAEWMKTESAGKTKRLKFLCDELGLSGSPPTHLRYQLFHRAASATLEARRWRFPAALMLVQSFAESGTSWQDYANFAALLGLTAVRDGIAGPQQIGAIKLYLGWVDSKPADDKLAATAV